MPASQGSRPEYEVSMCPLNMSDFPPPAPSHTPTTLGRSASTSTEMRQHLLPEQLDLLVPSGAPELEHHVRAACVAVLLDRGDAVRGCAGDRLALVEDLVR